MKPKNNDVGLHNVPRLELVGFVYFISLELLKQQIDRTLFYGYFVVLEL